MPDYRYRASDSAGKTVTGVLAALDEADLEQKLKQDGLWLLSAKHKAAASADKKRSLGKQKVRRKDLIEFCTGMIPMLGAGLPLVESLEAMSEELGNPTLRQLMSEIKQAVESGSGFAEAMKAYPKAFPDVMVNLIAAGEYSGSLITSFSELKSYFSWLEHLQADVRQATIYPSMVLVATVMFIMLLFSFVIPKFTALLVGLGVELPMPTRVVIGVGDFMASFWPIVFSIPVMLVVAVAAALHLSERFAYMYERVKFKLPLFGELNRMIAISRLTRNLSTMYRVGVPLLEALEFCRQLVGSIYLAKSLHEIAQDISEGVQLTAAFRMHAVFPPMVLRMVSIGESTGNLDQALDHVSAFYDEEIPRRIQKIFSIMEPAIIMVLVAVIGFVALSIFMPILGLLSAVH